MCKDICLECRLNQIEVEGLCADCLKDLRKTWMLLDQHQAQYE